MNIFVVAHYQNDSSPCACFVHEQMRAYVKNKNKVRVLVPVPFGKNDYFNNRFSLILKTDIIDGIEYYFIRYLSFSKLGEKHINALNAIFSCKTFIDKIFREFYPDIIHAHTLGFDSEIGYWLKKKYKCPLVVTTHGSDTNIPYQKGEINYLIKWCDRADTIVCVGNKLRNILKSIGTKTEIVTIANGYNDEYVDKKTQKKQRTIIQVCNLVPSKKVNITIKAFKLIKERYPDTTLTIVGDGPEMNKLIRLCADYNLASSVFFKGKLSNKEAIKAMEQSEFFVMVSSPEGFGIVYLEAMACECLVLGAENEGISDIIQNGENGFLLPVDDEKAIASKILWAMENPQKIKTIVENGQRTALHYTWNKNSKKYIKLFEKIVNKKDCFNDTCRR